MPALKASIEMDEGTAAEVSLKKNSRKDDMRRDFMSSSALDKFSLLELFRSQNVS